MSRQNYVSDEACFYRRIPIISPVAIKACFDDEFDEFDEFDLFFFPAAEQQQRQQTTVIEVDMARF